MSTTKEKLISLGRWFGRVVSAVAPFIPDPKAKMAAGAAAAVLNAATDEDEKPDPMVEKGDSA